MDITTVMSPTGDEHFHHWQSLFIYFFKPDMTTEGWMLIMSYSLSITSYMSQINFF